MGYDSMPGMSCKGVNSKDVHFDKDLDLVFNHPLGI